MRSLLIVAAIAGIAAALFIANSTQAGPQNNLKAPPL